MIKTFNSKKLVLCVCILVILAGLIGCSPAKQVPVAEGLEGDVRQEISTKIPKSLTIAVGAELTTLYPLNMDEQNLSATRLCYEGLVNYENGQVVPWLASDWAFSEDGKVLTFHLREDVYFHDGTIFDAQAVKENFEFKRATPNFRAWPGIVNAKKIEVVDTHTVAFHYDHAFFGYLNDFAFREIMVCMSPKVIEQDNFQRVKAVVGTGPYIYSEIKEGEYVKFIRNEQYWGEAGLYDEIIVRYIPDSSARLLALQKGEIDLIYGSGLITWDDYNQSIQHENISGQISHVDSKTVYFVLNAGQETLEEQAVREAIAYGIDKKGICDGLTYGYQKAAVDMFPAGNFLSNVPLKVGRGYDLEKAKTLLKEAGWIVNSETGIREKNGVVLSFKLTYNSGDAMNKLLSTTVKSQLKALGIDALTEGQDMMTWWKEGVAGNYGMIIWGTEENTTPHINFPKMINSSPHTPSLHGLPESEAFLKKIESLQTIGSQEEAEKVFYDILNYSNDHVLDLPLYYVKDMILYNNKSVESYEFTDTPVMFEIDNLIPKK